MENKYLCILTSSEANIEANIQMKKNSSEAKFEANVISVKATLGKKG